MTEGNAFSGINFGYDSNEIFKYRNENMCSKWNESNIPNLLVDFKIQSNPYGNYIVTGNVNDYLKKLINIKPVFCKYWAAAPPNYTASYAGSGLPYNNEKEALDNTPNKGVIKIDGDKFIFYLNYPNSYYINMGTTLIKPQVKILLCDEKKQPISNVYTINLGNSIPFRSLTWSEKRKWSKGPMFFSNPNLPIRTQSQILKDSGYPCTNEEPSNFWGIMPSP
jgi:hypothetical protein